MAAWTEMNYPSKMDLGYRKSDGTNWSDSEEIFSLFINITLIKVKHSKVIFKLAFQNAHIQHGLLIQISDKIHLFFLNQ